MSKFFIFDCSDDEKNCELIVNKTLPSTILNLN